MTTQNASGASPDKILDIATGYMAAKQLFAASRVGLFGALADGPRDAAALAKATGVTEKMARILADSMNGLGLLERQDGSYSLGPEAAGYLAGESSDAFDLAPFLNFLNEISYNHWTEYFDNTVATSEPGNLDLSGERGEAFMGGVMTYNGLHARELAKKFDFTGYTDLLDLGGLSSGFSVEAMKANPDLHTTFVFDEGMLGFVTGLLKQEGLEGRSTVVGAPTDTAEPEGEHDLVMVNHVIHRFTAEQNEEILRHARAAAQKGARLVLLDFFLDDDDRQRAIDALHAGEYLVIDGTVVWPEAEVRGWMEKAGWKPLETVALDGSPRIIVAEAV